MFLYEFHSEENIETARQQRSLGEIAYIPGENAALQGLGEVNRKFLPQFWTERGISALPGAGCMIKCGSAA